MKILMLTSSFDIGGAETHILELSQSLFAKGHTVHIASGGGVYESHLCPGIRHITLPLNSKNPLSLLRCAIGLRKLINSEKYDVIHSHSRLSSLIVSLVKGKTPLVTTAHWVFRTDFPYGILTEWGEKTLAVSNDIKRYLIKNYSVYPDSVYVTVNGIDKKKFSPHKNKSGRIEILHTSRLDHGRSLTAEILISSAKDICHMAPDSHIGIVGDGNMFSVLKKNADRVNSEIGFEYVTMYGKTEQPQIYSNAADIFVGVSRAALEAMSSGCAVILSGDEGYMSVFEPEKADEAADGNFCARGGMTPDRETLLKDIVSLYNKGKTAISDIGEKNRRFIIENYSVEKMTDDASAIYQSVIKKAENNMLICGYFGYGNFGDEAMLARTVSLLKRHEVHHITILCKNTKKESKINSVYAINRYNFHKVFSAIKNCNVLFFGGGNLLQNETSNRSLRYYCRIIKTARKYGKRTVILSGGIGKITSEKAAEAVTEALMSCNRIFLRTPRDCNEASLLTHGIADTVFMPDICTDFHVPDMSYFRLPKKPYILVALSDSVPAEMTKRVARAVISYGATPAAVALFPSQDKNTARTVKTFSGEGLIIENASVNETAYIIKNAEAVITSRLHGAIFAVSYGVHTVIINTSHSKKMYDFFSLIKCVAEDVGVRTENAVTYIDRDTENISVPAYKKTDNLLLADRIKKIADYDTAIGEILKCEDESCELNK